jgi:hypothetical protein
VDRSRIRVAAVSCAIACGAMVAGPAVVGSAVASADDLFGIDIDIFGQDDKKSDHADVVVGVGQPQFGDVSGAGPRRGGARRAPNLAPVPTAPSTRSIVIRAEHPASVPAAPVAPAPVIVPPVVPPPPVVVPLAPAPAPSPAAPPSPVIQQPRTNHQPPLADSLSPQAIPESFRVGYADYLRAADVTNLLAVALPGVAGILAFTAAGGVVGYRQARAAQALPPVGIARFLQ